MRCGYTFAPKVEYEWNFLNKFAEFTTNPVRKFRFYLNEFHRFTNGLHWNPIRFHEWNGMKWKCSEKKFRFLRRSALKMRPHSTTCSSLLPWANERFPPFARSSVNIAIEHFAHSCEWNEYSEMSAIWRSNRYTAMRLRLHLNRSFSWMISCFLA